MSGLEGPVSTGGPALPLVQSKESTPVEPARGFHNGVPVTPVTVENQIPPPPPPLPQKQLSDFETVEVIPDVEPLMHLVTEEQFEKIKEQAANGGLERVSFEDKGAARKTILRRWKEKSTWKSMDKKLIKKNGETSNKGFQKVLSHMKKMSFETKLNQDMMAYYALDKYHSEQFNEAQVTKFMDVFMDRHVEARANEKLSSIEKMLMIPGKGGISAHLQSPTIVLAELAASVSGEKKESTTEAALKDLSGFMHTELYDQDEFTKKLFLGFASHVQGIEERVAEGTGALLEHALTLQMKGSGKKARLTEERQVFLAEEVDRAVMKNIEGQLLEKRTRVEHALAKDKDMMEDAGLMLARATKLKSAMLVQIKAHAGPSYKPEIFEKMKVSEYFGRTAANWVQKNVVERRKKAEQLEASEMQKTQPSVSKTPDKVSKSVENSELHRGSMLDDISKDLASRAADRARALKEGRDPEILDAAAKLLKKGPKVAPKPKRSSLQPTTSEPVPSSTKPSATVDDKVGAAENDAVKELIRFHEKEIERRASKK